METITLIGIGLAGAVLGALAGAWLGFTFGRKFDASASEQLLNERTLTLEAEKAAAATLRAELDAARIDIAKLQSEAKHNAEKESWLEDGKKTFQDLAEKVMTEQRDVLTKRGRETFDETLKPFKEDLGKFKEHVETMDKNAGKERASLKTTIELLTSRTDAVSKEANELTNALKGSSQKQGAWGEVQLQRVLEMSGLQEGVTFTTQTSMQQEDEHGKQRRLRPDVIIKLPDERDLVIDAKLSLNSWIEASSAEDDAQRQIAEQNFLKEVAARVKELSGKAYESLPDVRSLDFTLMYMPIEAAFLFAMEANRELLSTAMKQRIVIVSPTTLLPILRTVEQIWRIDKQSRNTQLIVDEGQRFYDKLVGFLDSMEDIDKWLKKAKDSYDAASSKLHTGRGNLINRAKKLGELGVEQKKAIPASFQDPDEE